MSFSIKGKNAFSCLVAPSKIARALDWRKRGSVVLSIHVGKSAIDLAVTSHPGLENTPVQPLPSIPIGTEIKNDEKVLKNHVVKELHKIVKDWNVCGIVASWPVQREGWCGAACGKVLFVLDQLVRETNMDTPLCVWDGHHWASGEDEWGRMPIYGVPSSKMEHKASVEQYPEEGMVATAIARDFLAFHWPDLLSGKDCKIDFRAAVEHKMQSEKSLSFF